jgi:hypothetical protein
MPRGGVQTSLVGMVQTMMAPFRGGRPGKGATPVVLGVSRRTAGIGVSRSLPSVPAKVV